jgi:hypothetical protein
MLPLIPVWSTDRLPDCRQHRCVQQTANQTVRVDINTEYGTMIDRRLFIVRNVDCLS